MGAVLSLLSFADGSMEFLCAHLRRDLHRVAECFIGASLLGWCSDPLGLLLEFPRWRGSAWDVFVSQFFCIMLWLSWTDHFSSVGVWLTLACVGKGQPGYQVLKMGRGRLTSGRFVTAGACFAASCTLPGWVHGTHDGSLTVGWNSLGAVVFLADIS
ncbi:hypothetical protein Dimus_034127 [Dionaea muscipula]